MIGDLAIQMYEQFDECGERGGEVLFRLSPNKPGLPSWMRTIRSNLVRLYGDDEYTETVMHNWLADFSDANDEDGVFMRIETWDPIIYSQEVAQWLAENTIKRAAYIGFFVQTYGSQYEGIDVLKGAYVMWCRDLGRTLAGYLLTSKGEVR